MSTTAFEDQIVSQHLVYQTLRLHPLPNDEHAKEIFSTDLIRTMNLDLSSLRSADDVRAMKSQFHALFNRLKTMGVKIRFRNLTKCIGHFASPKKGERCCVWWTGHNSPFLLDLLQLFRALESQSNYALKRLNFKLTW